jgi:hypothetical protein
LQRGIADIVAADHIEPAQIGRVFQLRQALKHRGFDRVAGLPRDVQPFGGLIGAGAVEPVRDKRRQNVKEKPGDVTIENFGDLVDDRRTHVIRGCSVEPEPSRP